MAARDCDVVVIGGGVVGAATALELARRGAGVVLLEAREGLALQASGTNSGVLHTGFDSTPGELETTLIRRGAALRVAVLDALGVPVLRCGALLIPADENERARADDIARGAVANGVPVTRREDGTLEVPGEHVTDPVAFTLALAGAAIAAGATVRVEAPVERIDTDAGGLTVHAVGEALRTRLAVNCAGLRADEVARLAGDASFAIYPRKGEFLIFEPPGGAPPERILLPVPSPGTKGVLVFPTLDGKLATGPTAHDQDDKDDWRVRDSASADILAKVVRHVPALEGAEPIARYAGLRPAGVGCNYVIGPSAACPALIHVAAIRSTGLSASLGIAEHVAALAAQAGLPLGDPAPLLPGPPPPGLGADGPWWARTARAEAERAA